MFGRTNCKSPNKRSPSCCGSLHPNGLQVETCDRHFPFKSSLNSAWGRMGWRAWLFTVES
jgi:hypothetical protein